MSSVPAPVEPSLVRYDAACRAVSEAKTVDDVREISAQADAVRAYAKQAKNRQLELDAAEIRIRAERRLGELMAAQGQTVGKAKGAAEAGTSRGTTRVENKPASLAEAGIDKNLAHRARTYAAVPAEKFEDLLKDKRHRDNRRVVLDAEFQAEADAARRDIEIERDERIALAGAGELVAENEKLTVQVETLTRRVADLVTEVGAEKRRAKMWKERAVEAGWKGQANAA